MTFHYSKNRKILGHKRFYAPLLLGVFILLFGALSCSEDSEDPVNPPQEIDDTNARFVIDGSPWQFHRYDLLEIRNSNGSMRSAQELEVLIAEEFSDVVIEFRENKTGTEVGFDPIPSAFFWDLNTAGSIIFLDEVGNEFSPLGIFDTDIPNNEISFTFEFPFRDPDFGIEITVYGITYLRSEP